MFRLYAHFKLMNVSECTLEDRIILAARLTMI